jgi:hypothetical protein
MKTAGRRAQAGPRFSAGRPLRDPFGRFRRRMHGCARAVTAFARTLAGKRCRRREQMRQPLAFALLRRWGIGTIAASRRRLAVLALSQRVVPVPGRGSRLDLSMARSPTGREPLASRRAVEAGSVVRLPRVAIRYDAHFAALAQAAHTARPAESAAPGRWRDRGGRTSPPILQRHSAKNLERADRRVERSSRVFAAGPSPSLLPHRTHRSSVTAEVRRMDRVPARAPKPTHASAQVTTGPPPGTTGTRQPPLPSRFGVHVRDAVRRMDRMPARAPTPAYAPAQLTTRPPTGNTGTRQPPLPSRFGVHVRDALAPPFSARWLPASPRLWRAERPVQPIALAAARPRARSAESHGAFPAVEAVLKHPLRQPDAGASLAEMENTIIARIDKNIEKKVAAVVKQTIGSDAEYSRMTDHVYGSLYDRLILEKERLG